MAAAGFEHLPRRLCEPAEAARDVDEVMPRARREPQRASVALEQLLSEERFEHADLLRDRALGHVQLVGGEGEALQAAGSFEAAQRVQGRQSAHREIAKKSYTVGQKMSFVAVGARPYDGADRRKPR